MTKDQEAVKQWNEKAGIQCPGNPTIPDLETRKICAKLILEEALETIENGLGVIPFVEDSELGWGRIELDEIKLGPIATPDLTELADGCADLQVVTLGCASRCGIDLEPVFAEVMRSNESKWWTASEIDYEKYPDYTFTPIGGGLYVAKDLSGKIRKSPHYTPPNIAPILGAQARGAQ